MTSARLLAGMRRDGVSGAIGLALLLWTGIPQVALAQALPVGESEILVDFKDFEPPQAPESVAIDKVGNAFVSFFEGSTWKFTRDLEPVPVCDLTFGGGIAVDAPGNAYVIGVRFVPEFIVAVFRIPRRGGACEVFADVTGAMARPNALAFDKIGNLYVTDSARGQIHRITRGGAVEMWLDDVLLHPVPLDGAPDFIVGANGIQYWQGSLIVANTTQQTLVRIPIRSNGSAGAAEVLYSVDVNRGGPVFFPDGLALDVHGNIYAADGLSSQLVKVWADGTYAEIVAAAFAGDPLEGPTAVAFGSGMGDRKNMFVTNSGAIDPMATGNSSLIRIGIGSPGNPLP